MMDGGDVRDDFGVLPVVLGERARRAGRAFTVRVRDIALQERVIRNFHLVECQSVVEWADRDLQVVVAGGGGEGDQR